MADSSASGNSSSSKSLMWMMIAFFLGLSFLLGGGVFVAGKVVRAVGMQASSSSETIHTPGGSFRVEQMGDIGPGLPVYPVSSMILPGENATAEAIRNAHSGIGLVTYHSTDPREFVDKWYGLHLSSEYQRRDAGENPTPEIFRSAHISDQDIAFVAVRGAHTRIVALSSDETGTKISLIRMDKLAAQ